MNVGLSVSRVGGDAQTKAFRQVAGRLRLDMAAFRELAAFAQFGSDLDKATQSQLNRGQHLQEILKQPQYQPLSLENQVIEIFAGTRGYADNVSLDRMRQWETPCYDIWKLHTQKLVNPLSKKKRSHQKLKKN